MYSQGVNIRSERWDLGESQYIHSHGDQFDALDDKVYAKGVVLFKGLDFRGIALNMDYRAVKSMICTSTNQNTAHTIHT